MFWAACILALAFVCNASYVSFDMYQINSPKENCTCVPYYQCNDDGEIVLDGSDTMDYRNSISYEVPCTGDLDVCCFYPKEVAITETEEERPEGCGYHNPELFPWSGALMKKSEHGFLYKCGFSLIHKNVGITAAHCISNETGNFSIIIRQAYTSVKEVIIHPGYSSSSLQNDIALLILKEPVKLSDKVGTICIPPSRTNWNNTNCLVGSWRAGDDMVERIDFEPSLKMLSLPIVPRSKCLTSLRQTRLGKYFRLHKSFLCAGGEPNEDTCGGDAGNPLVCPVAGQPGRYHQAGIVSWGIGCGGDTPGVYVNLGLFRDWIDEIMIKYMFDITSYRY